MSGHSAILRNLEWCVSRTCDGGTCVKVAPYEDFVILGKTNQPDGPYIIYERNEWMEFIAGVKRGDFDGTVRL
jgi:uncharacterized protein DUF397